MSHGILLCLYEFINKIGFGKYFALYQCDSRNLPDMALICASSYSYIEYDISQAKIYGFLKIL